MRAGGGDRGGGRNKCAPPRLKQFAQRCNAVGREAVNRVLQSMWCGAIAERGKNLLVLDAADSTGRHGEAERDAGRAGRLRSRW